MPYPQFAKNIPLIPIPITFPTEHPHIKIPKRPHILLPMNKPSRIALSVVMVALAGVIGWELFQAFREREPAYDGKSLTFWLRTYAPTSPSGRNSPEWTRTDDAVRHLGTNCIPTLLGMIRQKDSPAKLWLIVLAQKCGLTKRIHFVPAAVQNVEASRAFIALGDNAKTAVPALIKIYNEDLTIESRKAMTDAFAWIGPAAKPAVPLLMRAATNANPGIRANASWALGEIHAEPGQCVPSLIQALNDSDDWTRLSAAHALGMFGSDASSATPPLMALTNATTLFTGGNPSVRVQLALEARNALDKINPPAASPPIEFFPHSAISE